MMWVNRAGMKSVYLDYYLSNSRIYLPWEGFRRDLRLLQNLAEFKTLVEEEKGDCNRTTISNLAGQLLSFCSGMSIGDYVLIPHAKSREYTLAKISGQYEFNPKDEMCLWHSRKIDQIQNNIPREIFSQSMQYSLGAFRTIFKIKNENECLSTIAKYK